MKINPKILILDSSNYINNLLLDVGNDTTVSVSVSSFEEFQKAFFTRNWDVILCQLNNKELLKLEVFNFVKKHKQEIPFIYCSESENENASIILLEQDVHFINNQNKNQFKLILKNAIKLSKTHKALKKSLEHNKQSKAILNTVNSIVFSSDINGDVTFVSPSIEGYTGYKVRELLKDGWYQLSFKNKTEAKKSKQKIVDVIAGKKELNTKAYDRKIICKNGDTKWFEWHDSIGENNTYVSVGVDITEWVKAKEQILQADTILKHINSMVFVSNKDGDILFASPSIENMLGYSVDEVLGNGWWEKTFSNQIDAQRAKKSVYKFVYDKQGDENKFRKRKIKTKEGHYKWIEWRVSKGINNTYISIGDDVTDRVIATEELEEAKEFAEESLKVKSEFIANMSHEIRTPMNAVIGFTDLLLETDLDDEQKSHLESMKNSGEILLNLINNILDLSKLDSNKFEIEKIPFNIYKSTHKIVDLMKLKADEKKVKLDLKITHKTPYFLLGDPTRISQILLNLIGNAIKFTKEGAVDVVIDAANETKDKVDILIEVKDTGIGILSNKINTVFGAFTQVKNDTSRIFGGTGLGLTIVKKLVDLMGGEIEVESEFGVGSLFKLRLPFTKVAEKIVEKKTIKPASDKKALNLNVLLVEDNLTNQLLAKTRLQRWKCTVDIANNGFEAVKMVEENNNYNIILMDIQMPVMDGFEATKIIKNDLSAKAKKIPIIAMTAHASKEDTERALELGMSDYIYKPFNPTDLYKKLLKFGSPVISKDTTSQNIGKSTLVKTKYKYIDLDYLQKETIGEISIMVLLIEMFIKDFENYLNEANKHLENKDFENLAKVTHKVKPSVSMIGISKMVPIIAEINDCSNSKEHLDAIPKYLTNCAEIFNEVKKELDQELKALKNE